MAHRYPKGTSEDLDDLRLFALGRIPRCSDCLRLRALRTLHLPGGAFLGPLPSPPPGCSHQVCAPIVERIRNSGIRFRRGGERARACNA